MPQNEQGKPVRHKRGWRYWLKLSLMGLVWDLVLFSTGYVKLYVDLLTRPMRASLCCMTPADLGLSYEPVTFAAADGTMLSGWYVPPHNGATVILLHGDGGNRVGMVPHAQVLARHGYGVLVYDLRACGESGGNQRTYGWLDAGDVLSAIQYLRSRGDAGHERVGVMGISLGGQIALRAAAQTQAIQAVIAEGPGTAVAQDIPFTAQDAKYLAYSWIVDRAQELRTGVSAPAAVVSVISHIAPRPILLVAAGKSVHVEGWELRYNQYLYEAAGQPKTLWIIPEAGHSGGLAVRPQEYEEKMVAFFDTALLNK